MIMQYGSVEVAMILRSSLLVVFTRLLWALDSSLRSLIIGTCSKNEHG